MFPSYIEEAAAADPVRRFALETTALQRAVRTCLGIGLGLFVMGAPAAGQETREQEIAGRQAEKATQLRPYEPSKAERIIDRVQRGFVEQRGGFFPYLGSVYSGGGFTLGGGYRGFYGDRSIWDVRGLYSIKNYKLIEATTSSPTHLSGRLTLDTQVGWRDATEVAYYGLGMDTSPDDRANFRFKETYVGGGARFRPVPWLVLDGRLNYEYWNTEPGLGSAPSIETVHTPVTAPGLGAEPKYWHTSGTAAIDWRTSPGYTRTGGYYGVTLHDYADQDGNLSFDQLEGEAIQHIPLLRETWVITLRGRMQTTVDDTDVVPYFLLPSLGSGNTLRAYSSWRFRDRHSLLTTGEFRWIPSPLALDMALFYDAGKVAADRGDLDFDGLTGNWGIGARFHGLMSTPLRIEFASGTEGWNIVFSGSAAF
jgi:hypothetical protein